MLLSELFRQPQAWVTSLEQHLDTRENVLPGAAQMTLAETHQGEIQPEAYYTVAFHPAQPHWACSGEDLEYQVQEQRKHQNPRAPLA